MRKMSCPPISMMLGIESYSGMVHVSQIGLGSLAKAFVLHLLKPLALDSWYVFAVCSMKFLDS